MLDIMLVIKDAYIKEESIPVYLHQEKTSANIFKNKVKKPMIMVHVRNINKSTALCLPTEEEWGQATEEYHNLNYINNTLFGPE